MHITVVQECVSLLFVFDTFKGNRCANENNVGMQQREMPRDGTGFIGLGYAAHCPKRRRALAVDRVALDF